MRRFAAVLALTLGLLGPAAVPAVAGGPNNFVVAESTVDVNGAAASVIRTNLLASSTGTDELTSKNIAVAFAHDCTGCRAVAVAFQAVIATGHPHVVTPVNTAKAVNFQCNSCASFAFAFQYVITTDGPAHLNDAGMAEVARIRQAIADAANSGVPFDQLNLTLEGLKAEFQAAIDDNLIHTGGMSGSPHEDEEIQETPAAAPAG
jgi:putative peptide zinc metalloprotease protein